jgi:hypothetical protein
MAGATLKRYIATIVCNPGTGQETPRDNAEILAAYDDEAVRQALGHKLIKKIPFLSEA